MKLSDVIHACSNGEVAEAALMSIGGAFAKVVTTEAASRGVPRGRFIAQLVGEFERNAGTCVWARAAQAMRGADQPVLVGLYVILAHGLLTQSLRAAAADDARDPAAAPAATDALRESEFMIA